MKILLISPYDAASHRYWWTSLVAQFPEHAVTVVTLPARHFSWRFRGSSLSLAGDPRLVGDWDLLVATSMLDLSALRGMQPALARVPTILYFHENQFAYPESGPASHRIERQITSLYGALSADTLVFNSGFNQDSFLAGVASLLARLPDHVPQGLPEVLRAKSQIVSVALDDQVFVAGTDRRLEADKPLSIIWNHRWEYDKGVDALEGLVARLLDVEAVFEFHLVGQAFRQVPPAMTRTIDRLSAEGRLGTSGWLESRGDYLALLGSADVVLSTALHEFQGLSVLEAIAAGCVPLVPDALAYREFVPAAFRYGSEDAALAQLLRRVEEKSRGQLPAAPCVRGLNWSVVRPKWRALMNQWVSESGMDGQSAAGSGQSGLE